MRILYVVGSYPSPTETFIDCEIQELGSRGHDVSVISVNGLAKSAGIGTVVTSLPQQLANLTHLFELHSGSSMKTIVAEILRGCGLANIDPNTDLIHAHFLGAPSILSYCLSQRFGVAYSLTAHARDIYVEKTPRIVIEKANHRITCTEANREFLCSHYPNTPFHLVRHGVDSHFFQPTESYRSQDHLRILCVGRLVEKKGIQDLVQALELLQNKGIRFSCRIIGNGPLKRGIDYQIRQSKLEHSIRIEPEVPHERMAQIYRESDVFALPSVVARDGDRDGVPNSILEAMASGIPVVATNAGSITEAIEHEVTGLLVSQRNPSELAQALLRISTDPELSQQLVKRAREKVEREFAIDIWIDKLESLIMKAKGAK